MLKEWLIKMGAFILCCGSILLLYGFKTKFNFKELSQDTRRDNLPCDSSGYITISGEGRFGNIISQYATLFGLSQSYPKKKPVITQQMMEKLRHLFKHISIPVYTTNNDCFLCQIQPENFLTRQSLQDLNCNFRVVGHPMSLPFISPFRHQLLENDFSLSTCMSIQANKFLERMARSKGLKEPIFVSVHVRRTDYENNLQEKRPEGGFYLSKSYFWSAMDYFREKFDNVLFVVASDDQKWCHDQFESAKDIVFTMNPSVKTGVSKKRRRYLDLAIMASCNHSIISFGTFGFWSAYLKISGITVHVDNEYSNFKYPSKYFDDASWIPLMDPCVTKVPGQFSYWQFDDSKENCTK